MTTPHRIGDPRAPITVTAKTRKRCMICNRMIEVGEPAVLTDDRETVSQLSRNAGNHQYRAVRGAFHLWHAECRARFEAAAAGRTA